MRSGLGAGGDRWERLRRPCVIGFFVALLAIGLITFDDFGVSWDEPQYYRYGELVADFYATGDRDFESYFGWRFYGSVVPVLHAVVADLFNLSPESAMPIAHLVNFTIFAAGVGAFYRLLLLQTRRWQWALLGSAFLVLSPRIWSHAFVNPKDGPFLALMIINVYLLVLFLEHRRRSILALLGLASGLLIDVRVLGLMMVGLVLVAVGLDTLGTEPQKRLGTFVRASWIYLSVLVPAVLLFWPYLWPDPLGRLADAFGVMREFTAGPPLMAFRGEVLAVLDPPWDYLPVWLAITTPMPYLALAALGLVSQLRRNPLTSFRTRSLDRHYYLYAVWLFAAPLIVIAGGSPLYDEWRHVNFVYPALIIFAVAGARAAWVWLEQVRRSAVGLNLFRLALLATLATVTVGMLRLHPYQALYFNRLTNGVDGAQHQFELDYWGLSYREGLAFLLREHPGRTVKVFSCTPPGALNAVLFQDRARLVFVERREADFAICAPRGPMLGLGGEPAFLDDERTVFSVVRDGAAFLVVKDLRV